MWYMYSLIWFQSASITLVIMQLVAVVPFFLVQDGAPTLFPPQYIFFSLILHYHNHIINNLKKAMNVSEFNLYMIIWIYINWLQWLQIDRVGANTNISALPIQHLQVNLFSNFCSLSFILHKATMKREHGWSTHYGTIQQ